MKCINNYVSNNEKGFFVFYFLAFGDVYNTLFVKPVQYTESV
jgi:hypothetical protein